MNACRSVPHLVALLWKRAMSALMAARPRPRKTQLSLGDSADCVWTIGYSGHTPDSFIEALRGAGITRVVDVRSIPLSRKPGFSKTALSKSLAAGGLEYVHMPELGAPRELLAEKKRGLPFSEIAKAYAASLRSKDQAVSRAAALARERPSALTCLEKDADECHRGILAKTLARRGLRVVHL